MRVLVHGVGSYNGGAELLLYSCVRAFEGSRDELLADGRRLTPALAQQWGVGRYLSVPKLGPLESLGTNWLPSGVRRRSGWYSSADVDAVLDASGFSYGDQWSAQAVDTIATRYAGLRRRGVGISLLPQAFGPFRDAEVARATRRLVEGARRVYARDTESQGYLQELMGSDTLVQLCPDMTIALDVERSSEGTGCVYVVPNINIPRRSGRTEAVGGYARSLVDTATRLRAAGLRPVLMMHSRHGDPEVVAACRSVDPTLEVVVPRHGLHAKQLIAGSAGVVGGRYHALVSALSADVPAVAHSWSHKYQLLLDDFGVPDRLADPFDGAATAERLLAAVGTGTSAGDREVRAGLQESVRAMWRDVLGAVRA